MTLPLMDQVGLSSDDQDVIAALSIQLRMLTSTLDGLIRVLLFRGLIDEELVDAINSDAVRAAFGHLVEDDDALAGTSTNDAETTE
jgi:hypothetical protein